MNDLFVEKVLTSVNKKTKDLIQFLEENGFSEEEIFKKINSEFNTLVSTIKYGDKPFSFNEEKVNKKEEKPEKKLEVNEDSSVTIVEINNPKIKTKTRTLKNK